MDKREREKIRHQRQQTSCYAITR